ncbi:TorF family putative porin [Pseudoduganella umbonata]|uniref:Uncharacterized protein (TIGR02001 family) n=1 Tax=Pseudoduganella umbonata TaxID=864828 RepID=A0A4P8HL68_9BURK|nr:TorF family putative porin [Pseudoduganella umbonata]MBB3221267.1 uncharacterized protein (TIGR02001 family) [Pseudoduganella umbonata]QCP10443.1 hypothetical protein FCL38_08385 [Pseudoduganella umbonata]
MRYRHHAVPRLFAAGLAIACALPGARAQEATVTGHVDLVSAYVLRGVTTTYGPGAPGAGNAGADAPESNRAALQWGADWSHPAGWYLGYFGAQINYSYRRLGDLYSDPAVTDFRAKKSVENDFYGGYSGKLGDVGYTLGLTGYVYLNGPHANALETKFGLSYGGFSAAAQTLLDDVLWGNRGDTYWTLNYAKGLPGDFTVSASLGWYTYAKEGKYLGTFDTFNGTPCAPGSSFNVTCMPGAGPVSGAFRHLVVGVTRPIGDSGFTWGVQGIAGGENRFGVRQKHRVTASVSYGF